MGNMGAVADGRFVAVECAGHATGIWDTALDRTVAELPPAKPAPDGFAGARPIVSASGDRAAIALGTKIRPLTVDLYGWTAIAYDEATGAELRRLEVRLYDEVQPERTISVDDARELIHMYGRPEERSITCVATHGLRPYRGSGPREIDWPAIHAAAIVVDAERQSSTARCGRSRSGWAGIRLGHGLTDAFGGSYHPPSYERGGLAGVVRVLDGANMIRRDAWDAVHRSRRIDGRPLAVQALRTALALDHLYRALHAVGVDVYQPASQICGVTGYRPTDTVRVTGLRWLQGIEVERENDPPTMREVAAFLGEDR